MRFLLSRRWLLFALAVVAMAWLTLRLGEWQFHRLDERRAENRQLARNLDSDPVPVERLMRVGHGLRERDEWRRVSASGTWDDDHTIVLKYQTREGEAGVDVVTPLVTDAGPAVLVDRGWLATRNSGGSRPDLPPPTAGRVTVVGWARVDGTGGATRIDHLATRALSSRQAAKVLPYPVYGGFVDLVSQDPKADDKLAPVERPDDTSEGPHFFYGLQWWFFGLLAVGGFLYLVYDEWRKSRPSERTQHAAVHRQHGAGDE